MPQLLSFVRGQFAAAQGLSCCPDPLVLRSHYGSDMVTHPAVVQVWRWGRGRVLAHSLSGARPTAGGEWRAAGPAPSAAPLAPCHSHHRLSHAPAPSMENLQETGPWCQTGWGLLRVGGAGEEDLRREAGHQHGSGASLGRETSSQGTVGAGLRLLCPHWDGRHPVPTWSRSPVSPGPQQHSIILGRLSGLSVHPAETHVGSNTCQDLSFVD